MAADAGEGVGGVDGKPVLEVGVAAVPLLQQAGGAEFELAEEAALVTAAGEQRPAVESLVMLDADGEAAGGTSGLGRRDG